MIRKDLEEIANIWETLRPGDAADCMSVYRDGDRVYLYQNLFYVCQDIVTTSETNPWRS